MKQTLTINGKEREFPEGQTPKTLLELLKNLDINTETVVAEIDGEIIQRRNFAQTNVSPAQSIELIRFVGGG